jgi:hypothetical protein
MKKISHTVLLRLVLALVVAFPRAILAQSLPPEAAGPRISWWHRTFSSLTWEEAVSVSDSPRDICWQVRRHVSYRDEAGDQWFGGRTIWNRGYGDCEDFAACVADLCEARELICWTTIVQPIGGHSTGHCVVMGLWKGQMWMASNGAYYEVSSLDDALTKLRGVRGWQRKQLEFLPWSSFPSGGVWRDGLSWMH